jgi:hypothetical protein
VLGFSIEILGIQINDLHEVMILEKMNSCSCCIPKLKNKPTLKIGKKLSVEKWLHERIHREKRD